MSGERLEIEGIESWSGYWAEGHAHSCPTSFHGFYGPGTREFWSRLSGLDVEDVVLDLGCGNAGLLTFLSGMFPAEQAPRLFGIDAATLDQELLACRRNTGPNTERIVVQGSTTFESLPFDAASVSVLTSQFGFEYGASDRAWEEVFRVLRRRARVAFIVHKAGSVLDQVARDELVVINRALAAEGVLGIAYSMVPYAIQAATLSGREALKNDAAALAVKQQYNFAVGSLAALGQALAQGGYAVEILERLSALFRSAPSVGQEETNSQLDKLTQSLRAHMGRLFALRQAAMDEQEIDAFVARFEQQGFYPLSRAIVLEEEREMGWSVEGIRG